jgi:hypothetical protein
MFDFTIDFNTLITWLLPPMLRQTIYYAWMQCLCVPVTNMYTLFMTYRTQDLYEVNHDSRVFSMQAVFNDSFDNTLRRIYIGDGLNKEPVYLYTRDEEQPVFLNPSVALWNPADYGDTGVDFIVWVPTALALTATQVVQLNALINFYRLASKRYTIYYFTP